MAARTMFLFFITQCIDYQKIEREREREPKEQLLSIQQTNIVSEVLFRIYSLIFPVLSHKSSKSWLL